MDEFVFDEVCTQVHVFFTFMVQSLHTTSYRTHKPTQRTINTYIHAYIYTVLSQHSPYTQTQSCTQANLQRYIHRHTHTRAQKFAHVC